MNKTNELCEMELTADTEERLSVLKKKLGATDRYIQQDNRDLAELESRYEKLDISYPVRRFLDDYIACADEIRASCRSVLSGRGKRGHGYCCCRE